MFQLSSKLAQDLLDHGVVRVGRVRLCVHQDGAGGGDGCDDVDVSAGAELVVVAGQAARQPDHPRGADGAGQLGLDLFRRPIAVAALAALDRLGDQHRAAAVDVDAAALVDHG